MSANPVRLPDSVQEIVDAFTGGREREAVLAISYTDSSLTAAIRACAVFERLRGIGGIHLANAFRRAMETHPGAKV